MSGGSRAPAVDKQTFLWSAPVGGSQPSGEPELRFATGPGIRHLIAGTLTPDQAVKQEGGHHPEGQRETA
jgi:hypothetical protein